MKYGLVGPHPDDFHNLFIIKQLIDKSVPIINPAGIRPIKITNQFL